jgi:hypothetical protein
MSDEQPIRISGLQAANLGQNGYAMARDVLKQVIEERTGKPHEWAHLLNVDAIELVPVPENPPAPVDVPVARVDIYEGSIMAQWTPGSRERLVCQLLVLIDNLVKGDRAPFILASEVEAVKA